VPDDHEEKTMFRTVLATAIAATGLAASVTGGAPTASAAPAPDDTAVAQGAARAAAAAIPGTLLFVRDHDVWIARPDGTGARPLTTDGTYEHPWLSPTQADNGLVVAARDGRIVTMTDTGRVVSRFDPPALEDSAEDAIDGTPADVVISPDGALIAYTFSHYTCPSGLDCDTRFATAYTRSDRLSDPATYGTTYGSSPSWINQHRTVQDAGQIAQVKVHDLGGSVRHWFRDSQISFPAKDLTDPTVSRDHDWVATVRGYDDGASIVWSRVVGTIDEGDPSLPEQTCGTNEEPVATPAFTADSAYIAWVSEADGLLMAPVAPVDGSCQESFRVLRDATQPSFSAATYRDAPPPAQAPVNVAKPAVTGTTRVGRTVQASAGRWSPAPSGYAYAWLRDGRAIRGATGARYRLVRADAGHRVSVKVTARGPGGTGAAVSPARRVTR
jgi:hypothetical protein